MRYCSVTKVKEFVTPDEKKKEGCSVSFGIVEAQSS